MTAEQFFANMGKTPSQFTQTDLDAVQAALDGGVDIPVIQNAWLTKGAVGPF